MLASKGPPWGDLRAFGETDFAALAPYRLVLEIEHRYRHRTLGDGDAASCARRFRQQAPDITILLPEAPRLNGDRVVAGLESTLSGLRIEVTRVSVTMTDSVRVTSELPQLRIAQP